MLRAGAARAASSSSKASTRLIGEDVRGARNSTDISFECIATTAPSTDSHSAYHYPGASEFVARLLDVDAGGAEHLGRNAPRPGSKVLVSFGTEGLLVREESESDGMRSYTAAWFAAVTPVTFVTATMAGQPDPLSLMIAGLHPVWSLSLRMASEDAVTALTSQVNTLSLQLLSWMHANHALECGSRNILGTSNDNVLCGTYAMHLELINRDVASAVPLREPVAKRVWFQIKGPSASGSLTFTCSDSHRSDAEVSFSLKQSIHSLDDWQVAQHVLFMVMAPSAKGVQLMHEVPPMLFLGFDSTDKAMAVSDLVAAAKMEDSRLKFDAQQRLQQLARTPVPELTETVARHCWRMNIASIEARRQKEREGKQRIKDAVAEQKRFQALENKLVADAVQLQLEANAQMQATAGDYGSVIISD